MDILKDVSLERPRRTPGLPCATLKNRLYTLLGRVPGSSAHHAGVYEKVTRGSIFINRARDVNPVRADDARFSCGAPMFSSHEWAAESALRLRIIELASVAVHSRGWNTYVDIPRIATRHSAYAPECPARRAIGKNSLT